jgi:hypothetical protein
MRWPLCRSSASAARCRRRHWAEGEYGTIVASVADAEAGARGVCAVAAAQEVGLH